MQLFRWGAATASAGAGFALSPSTNKLLLLCTAESGSNMTQTKSKHSMLADVKCIKCPLLTEKKNRHSLSLIQSSFENSHCCLHPHCVLSVISSPCLGRSCCSPAWLSPGRIWALMGEQLCPSREVQADPPAPQMSP